MMEWDVNIDGWIIAAGICSAMACALPGTFLVLRKMSLMGDAISHAVLPGLAIAFLITNSRGVLPMFIGAVIVGILTAVGTQVITRHGKVESGAAMGVVFSILFALGLVLIRQAADHVDLDPQCVLYGNLSQIPLDALDGGVPPAVVNVALALLLNIIFVCALYKELKICAFDPQLATTLGINANVMHYLLMVVVAVTTVASFEAVGSILVIAMLIVPAATARLLSDRMGTTLVLAVIVAGVSAVLGHLLAFRGPGWLGLDPSVAIETAAMIAVVTGVLFLITLVFAPRYGLVGKWYHRARLTLQIVREDMLGILYRWGEHRPGEDIFKEDLLSAVGRGTLARIALGSLQRRKAVESIGSDRVRLSATGRDAATKLVRDHRLWEGYMATHFDIPLDHLHEPAERIEHYLGDDLSEQLQKEMGDLGEDPHGRKIPE
ncbi:MAG TPA: iron chelate uptake ABC transporter family permease subunit [Phycisphaerae bacterium]|nr:iron chelate uptake ABC transporter family permease subunit [Phycisphaerae bacterium]